MGLASQNIRRAGSVRAFGAEKNGSRRARRRRLTGAAVMLGFLGALVAAVFYFWPGGASETGAAQPPAETVADAFTTSAPAPEPRRAPAPQSPLPESRPGASTIAATNDKSPSGADASRSILTMGQPGGAGADLGARSPSSRPSDETHVTDALRRSAGVPPTQPQTQPDAQPPQQPAPGPAGSSPAPAALDPATPAAVRTLMTQAASAAAQNRPADARTLYNRALHDPRTAETDRDQIRRAMIELSQILTFSPSIVAADPLSEKYTVASGDTLVKIARAQKLAVEPTFVQRVNRISNPRALRIGQTLKLVKGPFHGVVSKSRFRMDIYAGAAPSRSGYGPGAGGELPVYICSVSVGLGEFGNTPLGAWIVRPSSKLVNPAWTNPRTGEPFGADDPKNPIGERWLGLDGADDFTRTQSGYGIHGTIDPASIGKEMSMGCIRLLPDDIELVYELFTENVSTVQIVP